MSFRTYKAVTASVDTKLTLITGYQFAENAGSPAAARVLLRDGGASGTILADLRLAASGSAGEQFGDNPVEVTAGNTIYAEVNAGTVRGAVYGR